MLCTSGWAAPVCGRSGRGHTCVCAACCWSADPLLVRPRACGSVRRCASLPVTTDAMSGQATGRLTRAGPRLASAWRRSRSLCPTHTSHHTGEHVVAEPTAAAKGRSWVMCKLVAHAACESCAQGGRAGGQAAAAGACTPAPEAVLRVHPDPHAADTRLHDAQPLVRYMAKGRPAGPATFEALS